MPARKRQQLDPAQEQRATILREATIKRVAERLIRLERDELFPRHRIDAMEQVGRECLVRPFQRLLRADHTNDPLRSPPSEVTVKLLTGNRAIPPLTASISIHSEMTLWELGAQISEKAVGCGLWKDLCAPQRQVYFVGGKELRVSASALEEARLSALGIHAGATIQVALSMAGAEPSLRVPPCRVF